MKKMTCFNNPAFGQIRVIQADGKYLFCASDVAKSLGYKRPADAVTRPLQGVGNLPTPYSRRRTARETHPRGRCVPADRPQQAPRGNGV